MPGFFGIILGREVIPWEKVRLGFAVANPISWSQGISGASLPNPHAFTTFSSGSNLQSFQPTGAIAYEVNSKLRIGLSLGFSYDTLGDSGQINSESVQAGTTTGALTTLTMGGYAFQFISSLGVQYEVLPWLKMGAVVRSPSARLFSAASLQYDSLVTSPTGTQQVHFKSLWGDYEFFHPLEVDLGAAVTFTRGAELELDLRWHMASGTYNLTSFPGQSFTVVNTPAGGVPATMTAAFPDIKFGTRPS